MARPKLGETDTERMQLKITAAEIEAIDDWRFANRVPSRSEAVRRLCQIALVVEEHAEMISQAAKDFMQRYYDETLTNSRILDGLDEGNRRAALEEYVVETHDHQMAMVKEVATFRHMLNLVLLPIKALRENSEFDDAALDLSRQKDEATAKLMRAREVVVPKRSKKNKGRPTGGGGE